MTARNRTANLAGLSAIVTIMTIAANSTVNAGTPLAIPQAPEAHAHSDVLTVNAKRKARRARATNTRRLKSRSGNTHAVQPGVASWLILRRKCLDELFPSQDKGPCAKLKK